MSGHWLDVAHLERLHETFRALGAIVECLTVNEATARLQADAGTSEGHAFLPRTVVYLAGGLPPGSSFVEEKPWLRATSEAVMLAQGISRRKDASGTRLWLCTPHALRIMDDDVPTTPYLQVLWGLGRTLNLELLNCFGGLVDLGPSDDLTLRRMAATFLSAETHSAGDEFALRGQELWTRSYTMRRRGPARSLLRRNGNRKGQYSSPGGLERWDRSCPIGSRSEARERLILTSRRGEQAP